MSFSVELWVINTSYTRMVMTLYIITSQINEKVLKTLSSCLPPNMTVNLNTQDL